MSFYNRDCVTEVSTIFTFESPAYQNACNTIYINISTATASNNNNRSGNTNYVKFKSDYERMQYLIGLYGTSNIQTR